MPFGIGADLIGLIQSVLLIVSGILVLIASVGILNIDKDLPNVVYGRIHILGIVDIAGIIAFIALGQPLFALIYIFLAPFLAHAMANAYFYGEDNYNGLIAANIAEDEDITSSETVIEEENDGGDE